jgi:hypothetical protein
MDAQTTADWISKVFTPAAALIAAAVGLSTFWWSYVRPHVRRIQIVDLATKRIAFWDQSLKLELEVITSNPTEQQAARDRTLEAIRRIRREADDEMQKIEEPEPVKWSKRAKWLSAIFCAICSGYLWLGCAVFLMYAVMKAVPGQLIYALLTAVQGICLGVFASLATMTMSLIWKKLRRPVDMFRNI